MNGGQSEAFGNTDISDAETVGLRVITIDVSWDIHRLSDAVKHLDIFSTKALWEYPGLNSETNEGCVQYKHFFLCY